MAKMVEYYLGKSPLIPWSFRKFFEYFWHNVWTRNARNSIRGSKNSYFSL